VQLIVCQFSKLDTAFAIPLTRDVGLRSRYDSPSSPSSSYSYPDLHFIWLSAASVRYLGFHRRLSAVADLQGSVYFLTIVSNSRLTNDGFRSAWANLTERFENKRLLVKSQLKMLFSVQSVNQKSVSAIRKLQRTIQSWLTALKMSGIPTKNWDCLLVYQLTDVWGGERSMWGPSPLSPIIRSRLAVLLLF